MPTAVQLASAAFVNPLLKPLPNVAGLMAWSYWGGSLAASQNVIAAGGAYSNFGTGPTWSANYGHCVSGVGQILSAVLANAPAQTVLAACRWVSGGTGGAGNTIVQPSSGGGMIAQLMNTGASVQMTASGVASPTAVALTATNTAFKFYAFEAGGGNAAFVYNLTDGTNATGGTAGNMTGAASAYWIGGGAAGANNQQADIAFFALYNSFVSKANIDSIYAHVKDVLTSRGITV